ncbi:MAG: CHAT domain-containing protein [bacterium]|nr:MAG: CHAT domain-containing protein [bacterium]
MEGLAQRYKQKAITKYGIISSMIRRAANYRLSRSVLLIGLLFLLNTIACTSRKEDKLQEFLSVLPPDMAYHLTSSDDSTLAQYARDAGYCTISDSISKLAELMSKMSLEEYKRNAPLLMPFHERLARILASEYHYGSEMVIISFLGTLPLDASYEITVMRKESQRLRYNPNLTVIEKLEKQLSFLKKFEEKGARCEAAQCKSWISELYGDIGNNREWMRYLRAACSDGIELDMRILACQTLGVLGAIYGEVGKIDSMIICYEKAKQITKQSRLPNQASRISAFYSGYYLRQGRLSLVHDLLQESMELCREYKGGYWEIRRVSDAMKFYAIFECWEIVTRLCERARVLERKYEKNSYVTDFLKIFILRIDQYEARSLMARGNIKEAETIFRSIRRPVDDLPNRLEYVEMLFHWAKGLLENGRPDDAQSIIREGSLRAEQEFFPKEASKFALLTARAEFDLGNYHMSRLALQQFDHLAEQYKEKLRSEWIERYALLGMLERRTGNVQAAASVLEEGLAYLKRFVVKMDASALSYLWIGGCEELRQLMHEVTSHDPALGYGAELYWHNFYRLLGSYAREDTDLDPDQMHHAATYTAPHADGSIIDHFQALAESARARITNSGAIHSVYLVHSNEIWRWTLSHAGFQRETLDALAEEVRDLVSETWKEMSTDPIDREAVVSPALVENLRSLARTLLPAEVMHEAVSDSSAPFFITTDGFLGQIPFETFNVAAAGEYTPLLQSRDIAYLRYMDPAVDGSNLGPGVILVNADPSKELRNRYPFQQQLREVMEEGKAVSTLDPSARFLEGETAKKENLESIWEDASYIYLATHTLRDPEVPYLMLIPLASPGEGLGPDAAYLDMTDIRAADLSTCDIVVLSGCSSGAPYVGASNVGPSLGDAFLDAGAGAVVQTFWDIRDDEARRLMTSYVQAWGEQGVSKIHSLCNTRRIALRGPLGIRHPYNWASYSIKIGKL